MLKRVNHKVGLLALCLLRRLRNFSSLANVEQIAILYEIVRKPLNDISCALVVQCAYIYPRCASSGRESQSATDADNGIRLRHESRPTALFGACQCNGEPGDSD